MEFLVNKELKNREMSNAGEWEADQGLKQCLQKLAEFVYFRWGVNNPLESSLN